MTQQPLNSQEITNQRNEAWKVNDCKGKEGKASTVWKLVDSSLKYNLPFCLENPYKISARDHSVSTLCQ